MRFTMPVHRPLLRVIAGAALLASSAACAPHSVTPGGASSPGGTNPGLGAIRQEDLTRDMYAMAGDAMRGREGGTLDEMRASVWLADRMREAGLEPAGNDGSYFQWVPMRRYRQSVASRITVGSTPLAMFTEASVIAPVDAVVDAPLVFVAPDATVSAEMVRGKAVATVLVPAPPARPDATGRPRVAGGANGVRQSAARFLALGAVAVIVASDSASDANFERGQDALIRGRFGVDTANGTAYWPDATSGPQRPQSPPIIWVRRRYADLLRTAGQRLTMQLSTENFQYPSVNMVGRIRGTDARLRDENVLYSAHTDHDGVRTAVDGDSIWNGADDNASGAVAILAIARAYAKAPPRRSVLFVWHGSEERGLIGSRYFAMHPTVPRSSIVAVLNGEMIGRNNPDSMTILGSQPPHRNSATLVAMAKQANDEVSHFKLDTLWDMQSHPQGWYFRSDHLPYARLGIPAIAYTSDLHADYHTPRDDPSRIDYVKLTRVTRWMYATGWLVANADQRPATDVGFKLER
jgi:Peptidase family M28